MRKFWLCLGVVLLTACARVQVAAPERQTGHHPAVGERVTAGVGEVMVSRHDLTVTGTATVLAPVSNSFWTGRRGVAAGDHLVLAMASGRTLYCQSRSFGAPCLADTDNDQRFDRAFTINAYGAAVAGRTIDPVPYRAGSQAIVAGSKSELIYQGIDAGVVRIAYREFTDNLARPAFAQDLTYTLDASGSTEARFRDVRLIIHAADNTAIHYTVEGKL